MDQKIINHLASIRPSLDVLGEWLVTCNAKTAQKGMMKTILHDRQVTYRRGPLNYKRVWNNVTVPRIDDLFMFTFVRNPWDRVVSAFYFLQQYRGKWEGMAFADFIKNVLKNQGVKADEHFRPQVKTFMCDGEMIPGMFIGRFERIQSDWNIVADRLNVQKELPHFNRTRHAPYQECYDDASRKIVADMYAEEIQALGYEFGS